LKRAYQSRCIYRACSSFVSN